MPSSSPAEARTPQFEPVLAWSERVSRVSRSGARGPYTVRPAGVRPAAAAVKQAARQAAGRQRATIAAVRRAAQQRRVEQRAAERRAQARQLAERRAEQRAERRAERRAEARRSVQRGERGDRGSRTVVRRAQVRKSTKRYRTRVSSAGVSGRMAAVVGFARSQLGKRYAPGGDGPNSFDCSGFTKRAYAQIGLRLPHSSGAQAARARAIPRSAARPGDLVVGPGHVGVYMGRGMMIDAGNRRTGVVYRRLYAGLHIERF
jgi:cell wall-associated NlpC family hydrolase